MLTFETRSVVQIALDESAADRRAALNGDERAWARVYRDTDLLQRLFAFIGRQFPTGARTRVTQPAPGLREAVIPPPRLRVVLESPASGPASLRSAWLSGSLQQAQRALPLR